MANIGFHRLIVNGNNEYMNINAPGAPAYFRIQFEDSTQLWFAEFTWNGESWFRHFPGNATQATVQTQLDNFVASINAGTVTQ